MVSSTGWSFYCFAVVAVPPRAQPFVKVRGTYTTPCAAVPYAAGANDPAYLQHQL